MNVKKLKKNKKGFTLVEIIVVLVIIGILMALAVPAVMKYVGEAATAKEQSQVRAGYYAAQTLATSKVAENPGIESNTLAGQINAAAVNGELALPDNDEGKIEQIECKVTEQKIDSCLIKIDGSDTTYKATRNKIEKTTDEFTPPAGN